MSVGKTICCVLSVLSLSGSIGSASLKMNGVPRGTSLSSKIGLKNSESRKHHGNFNVGNSRVFEGGKQYWKPNGEKVNFKSRSDYESNGSNEMPQISQNEIRCLSQLNCDSMKKFAKTHKGKMIGTGTFIAGGLGTTYFLDKYLNSYSGILNTSSLTDLGKSGGNQNAGIKLGRRFITDHKYIIKTVPLKFEQAAKSEIEACKKLRKCKDKRIKAPVFYKKNSDGNYVLISEFAPGKNINEYAASVSKCNFKEKLTKVLQLAKQFCEIYWKLGKYGIFHSDISHSLECNNFVINEEKKGPVIYIFDFGRSTSFNPEGDLFVKFPHVDFPFEGISLIVEKLLGLELDGQTHPMLRVLEHLNKDDVGYMNYSEVRKVFSNNHGDHSSSVHKDVFPAFIKYLDKKVYEVINMNNDKVNEIRKLIESKVTGQINNS